MENQKKSTIVKISWIVEPEELNYDYKIEKYMVDETKNKVDKSGKIFFTYDEETDREACESAVKDNETIKDCLSRLFRYLQEELLFESNTANLKMTQLYCLYAYKTDALEEEENV